MDQTPLNPVPNNQRMRDVSINSACVARDCDKPQRTKSLCTMHYQRLNKRWSTDNPNDIETRFWDKCIVQDNGCWEWQGYINPGGYGNFGSGNGKVILTHRWTYQRFSGPLIEGMEIDHLCRNTRCCNPEHLEQVTRQVNAGRTTGFKDTHYAMGNRTHCKWGHEMTPENSYKRPDRVNSYACRKCMVVYNRNLVARKGLKSE